MGGRAVDQKSLSPQPRREASSSLSGSLESFPLSDVLALLAATGNTGALEVTGGATSGRLFVAGGAVVAAEVGRHTEPVEVVAELVSLEAGSFVLRPDEVAEHPGAPLAMSSLLAEVRSRLEEWQAVGDELPSDDDLVVLAPWAPEDEIVLTSERWRAVAAVGDGMRLGRLLERLGEDVPDAGSLVAGMVEDGLLEVVRSPADPAEPLGDVDDGDDVDVVDDVDDVEDSYDVDDVDEVPSATRQPVHAAPVPVNVVPTRPSRPADPALQVRLDALAEQFDAVYQVAQAAALVEVEAPADRSGLLSRLRHRRR